MRYYSCTYYTRYWKCKKYNTLDEAKLKSHSTSKIIESYGPELLDKMYLKYQLILPINIKK
jgi:hypothetical protein